MVGLTDNKQEANNFLQLAYTFIWMILLHDVATYMYSSDYTYVVI